MPRILRKRRCFGCGKLRRTGKADGQKLAHGSIKWSPIFARIAAASRQLALEEAPEPIDPRLAVDARLQDERRASALYKALDQLPPRQAQALRMRHLDELSNPEIAAIMAVSIEAVESLLARGRRQLKTCLEAEISALGYRDEKI